MAHATGSGMIAFGLVSVPVKFYTATSSRSVTFNLLHATCGSRIKQQQICSQCNIPLNREDLVRGYEFAKGQYVHVTDDELKDLEGQASKAIAIDQFVPLAKVDPIFFEKTYYLGPDKGGEKAYRLLTDAMAKSEQVAVARFVLRGKENIVLLRASQGGLLMHTMYFADEVRDFGEIEKGESSPVKDNELELALHLINSLATEEFTPEQYQDEYRQRVLDMLASKAEGREVTPVEVPLATAPKITDLAEMLNQSLTVVAAKKPLAKVQPVAEKKPAKKAKAS